jgi:hypothetical protein
MVWQPVQWQAMVKSGLALIFNRTRPQRQPPSLGKFNWLISISLIPVEMIAPGARR